MDNTITVNMENLTEEERNQLISLVKKSNKPKSKKRWRANCCEDYYTIFADGNIAPQYENNHTADNFRYNTGNYFQTTEEAKFEREKRLVYQELKDYALEHNENELDWNDTKQYKYYLFYSYGCISIGSNSIAMYLGQIYFTSREIAKNAVSSIGEDRIKKYLFGVK